MSETAIVEKILEREYGEPHRQDLHIEYFFVLLGKEIVGRRVEILTALNKLEGKHAWGNLEAKWPELLFTEEKIVKNSPMETERQREDWINKFIRQLLVPYADPNNPLIIISRACKYNTEVVKHSLSTTEIINDDHLDYFYLMIKKRPCNSLSTVALPSSFILAPLIPGNWRVVDFKDTWPHTFIGHFPKKPFETEREREWRLNHEVRLAFKKTLGGLLSQENQGISDPETLFSILFTRACKY